MERNRGQSQPDTQRKPRQRVHVMYALLVIVFAVCFVRLFYLQVIKHDYYKAAAQSDQYKEYQIPATRGIVKAYDGDNVVPIVLSDTLYTVYADPQLIKNDTKSANAVQSVLGGDVATYEKAMMQDGRYAILAKKVTKAKKDELLAKKLPGIGAQQQEYRTYPQGALAAQLLGFVDDSGKGRYGIEQAMNPILLGKPGELKAITDVYGVPLAASTNNVRKQAVAGKDVVLTIDIGMQAQVEKLLKAGLDRAKSESGSALVLEAKTGAVKAMANWPSYNPSDYTKVEDASLFSNMAVSDALEVGSVMKPLTVAAGLNMGVITPTSSFFDQRFVKIDDATVRNVEEDGGVRQKTVADILNLSLNTGATWILQQMGGGELNRKGREAWHDYMVNHYYFGKETGIEQGYESGGTVPSPTEGYGLNIAYANTAFGQAMTATILQMASAYASVLNGGTYYQPHLVAATVDADGTEHKTQPKVVSSTVVKPEVSKELQPIMEYVVDNHRFVRKFDNKYAVGGKTGTAQIANPAGGYFENEYNGTYIGFVGGDDAEYIIAVRVNKPKIAGYAGSQAAQPLFGDIAHMLLDSFNVNTKTQ